MYLVSGATGNIGPQAIHTLAEGGHPVRALVRDGSNAQGRDFFGAQVVVADYEDPASLERALDGVTAAYMITPVHSNQSTHQRNFLAAARKAGVRRVVKSSAMGSVPDSPVNYLRWHADVDEEIRQSDFDYTILYPNVFMQQFFEAVGTVSTQGVMYGPFAGGVPLSVVDSRDIGDAAAAALVDDRHIGKEYRITGPESITFNEMMVQLGEAIGKPVQYVPLPPEAAKGVLMGFGLPEWQVDGVLAMNDAFMSSDFTSVSPAVEEITGRPGRSFAHFAREYAPIFRGEAAV